MKKILDITCTYLFYVLVLATAILVFVENFIFCTYGVLPLRSIDDAAFQTSLFNYHNGSLIELLSLNDYGYGWIYWFPMVLLTLPAHWIGLYSGSTWLLCVIPRMYSLGFSLASCYVFYKIVSLYTKDGSIRKLVTLLLPLFPTGCYLAGRFSTVPQVTFFSLLSFYYLVKNEELMEKDLRKSLIFFAVAMATKVSAICMAPVIVFLVLLRSHWKIRKNCYIWIKEILLSVIVMILLMNPSILVAIFYRDGFFKSIGILKYYWFSNSNTSGLLFNNLHGLLNFCYNSITAISLIACCVVVNSYEITKFLKDKDSKYLIIPFITSGLVMGVLYLCITINKNVLYVWLYAHSIVWILPLFYAIAYEKFWRRKRLYCYTSKIFIILLVIGQMAFMCGVNNPTKEYSLLTYYKNRIRYKDIEESINNIQNVINKLNISSISLYTDKIYFTVANGYDMKGKFKDSRCIWDDFGKGYPEDRNVIVLDKMAIGFLSNSEFVKLISFKPSDIVEQFRLDRASREKLLKEGTMDGRKWRLIYEDNNCYVYIRLNE